MKKIACLAWGSLVWDPQRLPIRGKWFDDGPIVRVEFLRQSGGDRLTLVLHEHGTPVRSLWALMTSRDVESARHALRKREKTSLNNIDAWEHGGKTPELISGLEEWAAARGIDTVIWTALRAEFKGKRTARSQKIPSPEEAVDYLDELEGATRDLAERYIRRAPKQIDTEYRRLFEVTFGWTYQE